MQGFYLLSTVSCEIKVKLSTLTVLHVMLHSEIDTSQLAGRWRVEQASANVSCSKTLFLVNSVYTNNVLNARVHV